MYSFEGNNPAAQNLSSNGPSIVSMVHGCPYQSNMPPPDSESHNGGCQYHCHCQCVFLKTKVNLSSPTLNAHQSARISNFYPNPFKDNLFRPPIV